MAKNSRLPFLGRRGLEKSTIIMLFLAVGIVSIIFGLVNFGLDWTGYAMAIIFVALGMALILEVGLKHVFSIKNFGIMQGVSILVAMVLFLSAFLNLPFVSITIEVLASITSVALIIAGFMLVLEAIGSFKKTI